MPKAATTECVDCHYRFEKPKMHQVKVKKETGRSSGISANPTPRKGKSMNPRFSSRTYYRTVTEWLCDDCYKKREAASKKWFWQR